MDIQNHDVTPVASHLKCEIKIWHTREDGRGNKLRVAVEGVAGGLPSVNDSAEQALVVERGFDKKGRLIWTTLTVNTPHVLKALRDTVGRYPTVAADFTESFTMSSPFQMLYHHWEDLDTYKTELADEDDDARMHLNLLFGFMESEMGDDKRSIEKQFAVGRCEFENLWLLFKPGTAVITSFNSHTWLMRVWKTAYHESHKEGKTLRVYCIYTGHNGKCVGDTAHIVKIFRNDSFAQGHPEDIINLPIYPRRYYAEDEALEDRLRSRGNRFAALSDSISIRSYDGAAEYCKEKPPDYYNPEETSAWQVWCSYVERGRVVLDLRSYLEEHKRPKLTIPPDESMLDMALCPPYVFGYSCGRKAWGRYLVSNVGEANWRPDPFSNLELPNSQKRLVQALVSSHNFPNSDRDKIEQKGKGLVFLLHGPPGSGKTLTAECAAELSHRALLSCSLSELNKFNSPWDFEQRLSQILRLATVWKAVVLLDEADVFLEARRNNSPADGERNALVAIFLRHLEYFSGIVFLTTNRVHVFDNAMKSRIHLALGYLLPDKAARRAIWRNSISQLPKEAVDVTIEEKLDDFAVKELNGREIANMVTTASTFARFEQELLQAHHFEMVMAVRRDFEMTLEKRNLSEDQSRLSSALSN